jgi:hypothetical protein
MHNDFVMPRGQWTTVPAPAKIAQLDQQTSESVNGDAGGTWAPETPIAVGGAGLTLNSISAFSGGVRTRRGYSSASKPRIHLSTGFPRFGTARSRTVVLMPPTHFKTDGSDEFIFDRNGQVNASERATTPAINLSFQVPQSRLHNGGTLTSATFRWRLTREPSAIPGTPEAFALWRTSRTASELPGPTLIGLHSDDGVLYASGQAFPSYANLAAYWANGSVKSFTYTCNQNHVIDTGSYIYTIAALINDRSILHSIELTFGSIADQRFE